ncbi:hypothetical protein PENVUL_c006G06756 [Penicillium vulpinum]|uniref:Uncharacterized protein n=1 Tax=Penicillium vulpinum TaxID=29845 RepID=A0A1V6S781_9EURO|nr:hypothetical protein PENVUL_c006G06756 [Penicillium vulpinum]
MRVFSTLEDNPCGQMIGSVGPFKCLTTEVEMITGVMIIPPVPLISLPWANKIFHYGETVDHEPCEHDKVVSHGYVDGATVYQIPADSEIGRVYDAMVEGEEKQAFIKAHAHTQHEISESPYHWDI